MSPDHGRTIRHEFPPMPEFVPLPLNLRGWRGLSNYVLLPEMIVSSAVVSDQFSEGFSAPSITKTSTGPLCDSSLRPSCSCTAVKIDGCESSGGSGPVGSHA
jgi:hypothetical protein